MDFSVVLTAQGYLIHRGGGGGGGGGRKEGGRKLKLV